MRSIAFTLPLLLIAGCAPPTENVRVAPAVAVVDARPTARPAGNPLVGGVAIPADRNLAAGIAMAPNLSGLTRAVSTAGLTDRLAGPGPFTLFAPSDQAFGRLAPGTVEALMKPENRAALTKLLTLHLVPGRLTTAELVRGIQAGGGRATLATVSGEPITATLTGAIVTLTDTGGNRSYVEFADVAQANGVLHVVNGVLVPRLN